MPKVCVSTGVEIAYESYGDEDAPPVLLTMGLACSLVYWEEAFFRRLLDAGYRVIRFDNRDIGESSRLRDLGKPNLTKLFGRALMGLPVEAPYTLKDMALDTAGLLDALEIPRAHIVGVSMGGMIGQTLAIEHPERVLSLASIMSSSGDPAFLLGRPDVMLLAMSPAPRDREKTIAHRIKMWRALGGRRHSSDEARLRELATCAFDRGYDAGGVARQLAAILAATPRRRLLAELDIPVLVVHGDDDPLIPVEAGIHTAESIPHAKLVVIEGMGHDMPPSTHGPVLDSLLTHLEAAS